LGSAKQDFAKPDFEQQDWVSLGSTRTVSRLDSVPPDFAMLDSAQPDCSFQAQAASQANHLEFCQSLN
jgi:hypothetical protein